MLFNTLGFASAILAAVTSCCLAQYPYQVAPPAPRRSAPAQHYQQQPPPAQNYRPQQQAPAQRYEPEPAQEEYYQPAPPPQPARRPHVVPDPAAVHYVNIGAELQGDYKFGYDTGKGNDGQSFREETRLPDGTVQGAYGYVDAGGIQRIVRYTAGKDGFRAEGDGVPKAPPAPAVAPAAQAPAPRPRPAYQAPQQQPQPTYSAPQQPAYSAPQQPAYSAPSHNPRPAPQYRAPRPAPAQPSYDYQDYSDPNNDLSDTAAQVPIDTSLFNYNIGAAKSRS